MKILEGIRKFHASRKKYIVTLVLAGIVLVLGIYSVYESKSRTMLEYPDNLNKVAVTVGGTELTLKDLGFYVAYEESEVESQAEVYEPDDTKKYWNLHIDGEFVKVAARNAAIQMAIHDQIFYDMAIADGIELTEDEQEALKNSQQDFWADLTDEGRNEKLGVEEKDIQYTMFKAAMAQKYQQIYEELQSADEGDYSFSSDAYQKLLEQKEYKINKNVWSRVDFGNVTLEHS